MPTPSASATHLAPSPSPDRSPGSSAGSPLPFWVDGPADAPVVVFVHGATATHRSWKPQVEALRDRFRTVTVELAGHGVSGCVPFEFDTAVTALLGLLDRVERPVALVGSSLGGAVVQEAVRRAPGAVDALVVADTTCLTAPRSRLAKSVAVAALFAMALLPGPVFRRRAAHALSVDQGVSDRLHTELEQWSPLDAVEVLVELVAALHPDPAYRLPVPTLLLHGDADCLGDIARSTRAWAERDPRAEYTVVPDAGHVSNQDNPDAFTAAVRPFLNRALPDSHPNIARTVSSTRTDSAAVEPSYHVAGQRSSRSPGSDGSGLATS